MTYTKRIALTITGLLTGSLLILLVGYGLAKQGTHFFPASSSKLEWFHSTEPAQPTGQNYVKVTESGEKSQQARFSFHISPEQEFPYTSYNIYFANPTSIEDLADLSPYSKVSFKIRCEPQNILVFSLYSYAEGVTLIQTPSTFRVSSEFFTCNSQLKEVSFRLKRIHSAIWWIERYGVKYTNLDADLRKVHGIAFNNSLQSPRGLESEFTITELKLVKENYSYLYVSIALIVLIWVFGLFVLVRLYIDKMVKTAKSKINDNRPLIAYQQLSLKQKDESLKTKVLQHIAVHYSNPDINIDGVAEFLGTNRIKINEILKGELGLTFTSYVNRLRLTEAARLLALNEDISVKQIAHQVGFSTVTYFNTLFKKEYGCTPKSFANGSH